VLILYEKIGPLLNLLAEMGAVPDGSTPVVALPSTPAPGAMASPGRDLLATAPSALIRR
jgi:hypothetical protein